MSGPVERWLGTFMCKQYAYLFEEYGFKTLQQVCQLQRPTLHSMGIPPDQCEKILENVNVLRQSLLASSPEHMGSHDASFPPPSYGMRHNMHSPHYPGPAGPGCTYQEHPYENQMGNHNQSNNYNYHPSSPYPPVSPSPQQYSGHGSQMHSTVPYSNSQAYSGSQGTQYTNQEVYGQQLGYNSRIHQPQASWENNPSHDLRTYNQSPRTAIGSSPPPSVMRSPPPGPGMAMPHYRQMMMNSLAEQPPHNWSQSQIPSPGMMHSPRTTPSPGMGHASGNLTSPGLPNRSPAHKPFSPPPFSSHGPPPPAHQQQSINNYEYPGNHPVSPAGMTPNRSMPSPGIQNPPARNNSTDPLQSLQKMVLLEGQAMIPSFASPGADQQSANLQKPGSNFGIEQLVAKEANSTLNSSSPSSLSSTSSVSQPQKFAKPEGEHINSVSSRDSEQPETKEETNEIVPHPVTGESAQSTSSPQITPSSASSPQNKELPSNEVNNASQSTAPISMPMHKGPTNVPDIQQTISDNRTDSVPMPTTVSNHSNGGGLTIMQPPRNRWKNSSVSMVNSDYEMGTKEKYYSPSEQNTDGNGIIMDAPISNGQVSDSIHNHESTIGDSYAMKNQKFEKMVDIQPHFARQEEMPNNSYINRNDANVDYRNMQQHDFQNNIVAPVRKPRFSRKLRGRKAAMASRMENHHVNNYPYSNSDNSMEGDQVQHYYENNQMDSIMKKCRGPIIQMSTKSSVYVDGNSMPEMDMNYMQMRPPYKKPPYLSQNTPPYNLSMSDSETAVHMSDSISKPMPYSPMRTNMSQVPSQLLTLGNAMPSVKLTDCSKRIKEELKVNSYVSAENMSSNRMSDPSRMGSDEYLKMNCSSGTDTSGGDMSMSTPKKRRGRPPGSKNKPKPPGFEKEKRTKKKVPENPAPVLEKPAKKRKVEEKKTDVPISVKLRGPFIHIDCSKSQADMVMIVNTTSKEEEMDSKGFKKKKIHNREGGNVINSGFTKRKLAKIGFTSTLSAKYDAVTKDKTWICALCHKGSHYQGLGDLFGPYFETRSATEVSAMDKSHSLPDTQQPVEPAENSELPTRKGKRSKETEKEEKPEANEGSEVATPAPQPAPTNGPKEIWMHEDCIVWSHGVYLVGNKICGLQEAARVSADMVCCKCKETGATLGCFNKGCTEQYHYICAVEKGCQLDEANYSMLCPKHKKKTRLLT